MSSSLHLRRAIPLRPVHGLAFAMLAFAPGHALATPAEGQDAGVQIDRSEATRGEAVRTDAILGAVRTRLSASFTATTAHKKNKTGALVEYYAAPNQKLLWVDTQGLSPRGKAVVAELKRADQYGLRARDYAISDIEALNSAAERLAEAEIAISHAVLDYSHDARGGRVKPQRLSKNLDPVLNLPKPLEVIESIAFRSDPAAYLRSFQPQHAGFERLRKKLIELRGGETAAREKRPSVQIPNGPLLKLGDTDPQVALLRTRLKLQAGATPESYDEAVLKAVKRFQAAHNTAADGVVGPGTRRLLNNPSARNMGSPAQIRQILLNMERWRWLPQDRGQFYVTVNIPEFMLRVVKDDEAVHTTRVVVGKPRTPTPVLSEDMTSVVFGPYWNVPNSIKTGEIRPYIRPYGGWYARGWDTRVFQQQDLHIKHNGKRIDPRAVDWARVDIRKLHLYQPPSKLNVLGRVKFVFPNKHIVYMHDTPQKHFFRKAVRAESHGCMRVQNPDDFAAVLLKNDANWSAAKTKSAFNTGYDKHIALKTPVPVYTTYFTLQVNEDGSITTFRDLYGHDRRMSAALLGGRQYAAADSRTLARASARRR